MTKTYIGCKIIQAEPDVERDAHGTICVNPRDGYRVKYSDGYTSWSPKDVFEEAYVEVPADAADAILGGARDFITVTTGEIRAAEQRGYDAARPLDPDKIMIGDQA